VDDSPDIADSTADLLQVVGYEVRACYGSKAALAEAAAFRPDLCIIDLNMPGMEGDELAGRLRKQAGPIPVVLVAMTAMSDEKSVRRVREAGFALHLVKPVEPTRLLEAIELLLQTSREESPRGFGQSFRQRMTCGI
jgi:DNA-binding response OmpR family regulator